MHKLFIRSAFTALICGSLAGTAFAQSVSLSLKDGRVTLKAENATVRQILDEWARVGQAKIVNADKLTGQPITLTLVDKPEREALDIILRGVTGYVAVDRTTALANASAYERLLVMAKTTTAVASASSGSSGASTFSNGAGTSSVNVAAPVGGDGDEPMTEPPSPAAPVMNPYSQTPNGGMNMNGGAAGVNVNGTTGANGAVGPDVKFDYANPVPYFERQRQLQQQQQQQMNQPTATPMPTPGGAIGNPNGSPMGPALLPQPGIAPPPQQQANPYNPYTNPTGAGAGTSGSGAGSFNPYNPPPNFNPYNLKPGEPVPGTVPQQQGAQPDRSKYVNPYQPQPTPPQK